VLSNQSCGRESGICVSLDFNYKVYAAMATAVLTSNNARRYLFDSAKPCAYFLARVFDRRDSVRRSPYCFKVATEFLQNHFNFIIFISTRDCHLPRRSDTQENCWLSAQICLA
jgi:hypothetical protein